MCRMIFAKGKFDVSVLIDDMITMALDKNERHEENANRQFQHSHGWGLCYMRRDQLVVYKSIKPIFEDPKIDEFRDLKTDLFILHTRRASSGEVLMNNVHPFCAIHGDYKYYFFHNGTIFDDLSYPESFTPTGTTDSEKYFYYLLGGTNHALNETSLRRQMVKLKKFTGANFILTNGQKTFIANWHAVNPLYYTMKIFTEDSTTIIASEILPHFKRKNWKYLKNHEILTL